MQVVTNSSSSLKDVTTLELVEGISALETPDGLATTPISKLLVIHFN